MFETHKHITISIKSYKLHRTLWPRSWCWTLSGFYFIFLTISSLQSTMRFADGQTICRAPVDLKTWLSTDRKHLTTGTSPSSYCAVMVALHSTTKDIIISTAYRLTNSMISSNKRINEKFWHWVRSKGTNGQTHNLHRRIHMWCIKILINIVMCLMWSYCE